MKIKHLLRLVALVVCMASLTLSFTACGGNPAGDLDNVVYVEIDMQSGDYMKLELYTTIAPITVSNFVELCNKGFYDGLIFHRVISGFMLQGGGYTEEMAIDEALRCLNCKNMPCVSGCPVNIHIPEFITKVKEGDFEGAYKIISKTSVAFMGFTKIPKIRMCILY